MTERSYPWGGTVIGDATLAPYSDDEWSDLWSLMFQQDRTSQGVLFNWLNELAVSGTATPVLVASGAALVDGKLYESDGAIAVAIPTPSGATRIDRIVLRKDWALQTVRVTRIAGVEGGGAPSVTQTDGITWDISLATVSITTGGAITVTDARTFNYSRISPGQEILGIARRAANQSIGNGAFEPIQLDTEDSDFGSYFNIGANNTRLTFVKSGFYNVSWSVSFVANATGYRVSELRRNGGAAPGDAQDEKTPIAGAAYATKLNPVLLPTAFRAAGDYYENYVFQNSGGPLNAVSRVSVELVKYGA